MEILARKIEEETRYNSLMHIRKYAIRKFANKLSALVSLMVRLLEKRFSPPAI